MTVGGVDAAPGQPAGVDAVESWGVQPPPPHAPVVSLAELYERTDWFAAAVDAEGEHLDPRRLQRDGGGVVGGGNRSLILEQALADLPDALAAAADTTYVPWQDSSLATDDFLVVRLMEIVVHADDLAASIGPPDARLRRRLGHLALALLAMLGAQRHGQDTAVRALSREERAARPAAAF